ncbi:tail assembly chaperone [Enterococcus faecium]|uniref:tail assembly chaperone n=1 Tax=Enterococcus faecium TaxID=1352 RepID=UPI00232C89FF|nr:tail assembly chaperone [Enterococcus faecium]WCG53938.1 tail assembly chaperone [Enterococcus faecium]HDI5785115.1 hypothetical protein [Enterococcus faecium]
MAFTVELKGKTLEIKFNYALLFKANKRLASKDANGNPQNDGAGVLFAKVLEKEDDALLDIIKLAAKGEPSENEVLEAIAEYIANYEDEEEGYNAIFENLKEEMINSGFFLMKIKKYIKNLEKAAEAIKNQKPDDKIKDPKASAQAIQELADMMKKEISSLTAQDKD